MPQPSKMQKRSRGGLRAQIGRVPHTPQDGFTARDQMADGFVILKVRSGGCGGYTDIDKGAKRETRERDTAKWSLRSGAGV